MWRKPYVWALVILVIVTAVVFAALLSKAPEADPFHNEQGLPNRAFREEPKTHPSEPAASAPMETAVQEPAASEDQNVRICDARIMDSGLILINVGREPGSAQRLVGDNSFLADYIPHTTRRWWAEKCWLCCVDPRTWTLTQLATGEGIHGIHECNDRIVWHQGHHNESMRCTGCIARPGEPPVTWESNGNETNSLHVLNAFSQKNLLIARRAQTAPLNPLRRFAANVMDSAVQKLNEQWRYPLHPKVVGQRMELWDANSLQGVGDCEIEPMPEWWSVSPLFGDDANVFLVCQNNDTTRDYFLSLYSLSPLKRLAQRRIEPIEGFDFKPSGAPGTLIGLFWRKQGPEFFRISHVPETRGQPLQMEAFDPGPINPKGWAMQWANGFICWKEPEGDEIVILKAETDPVERTEIKGLSSDYSFRINADATQIITWNASRLDIWNMNFPDITWDCGYKVVAGTDGPEFIKLTERP